MKDKRYIGIYVHIPFCLRKCKYCDFLSSNYDDKDMGQREKALAYINALCKEIKLYSSRLNDRRVSTIYIGGGTPSVIDTSCISKILDTIREFFCVEKDVEITMEVNPATLLNKKVIEYKEMGINRISMGMQSTEDKELKALGRAHTYEEFKENYIKLREIGYDNINIDIMSAIPYQTLDSYKKTLERVVGLRPEHISSYSLIIEEGTYFYNHKDELELVSEEEERQMYYYTKEYLARNGYKRYEVSNYALEGKESKHNSSYWIGIEYIGFGVGASSYIEDTRYDRISDVDTYIDIYSRKDHDIENVEINKEYLTIENRMEEYMFLGLRMSIGISISEFKIKFKRDIYDVYGKVIQKYIDMGHMMKEDDRLYLTDEGLDVSNTIFADFLL